MRSPGLGVNQPGALFINIGNSWVFHARLLMLARRMPSVIVLHDLSVQEMLLDAIHNKLLDRKTYLTSMSRWYGENGRSAAQRTLDGSMSATELGQHYPGFELAMDGSAAVLTHTPAAAQAVTTRGYVPSYELALPFRANGLGRESRATAGSLRLVQFGHIGPNRRLEQVLEALAGMGPAFDFIFDIVGRVWNPDLIRSRCADLGLSHKVHLHGYIPESDLDALIARAHLVFNLRHPTMGEASGSQLRIWNAAAASVVTDQGWYHHLPKDTVFHISLTDEVADLQKLLARLDADRHLGQVLGRAGYQRLVEYHCPAHYADGVLEITRAFERDIRDALLANSARRLLSRSPDVEGLKRNRLAMLL
jgi:glycosyltransferase involved in cell wall biosynthesis